MTVSLPVSAPSSTRSLSQRRSRSRAASGVAAWVGLRTSAKLKKSCWAITLLLNLLISRTTSKSGGERNSNVGLMPAGAGPSRTAPLILPPISRHIASNKRWL